MEIFYYDGNQTDPISVRRQQDPLDLPLALHKIFHNSVAILEDFEYWDSEYNNKLRSYHPPDSTYWSNFRQLRRQILQACTGELERRRADFQSCLGLDTHIECHAANVLEGIFWVPKANAEEYIRLLAKDRLQRRIVACTKVQVHVHGRAPAGPDSSSRINLTVKPRSELGQALENVQLLEDLKRMKRNLGIFPVYTAARYYVNRRRAQKDVRNLADKPSHLKHMLDL